MASGFGPLPNWKMSFESTFNVVRGDVEVLTATMSPSNPSASRAIPDSTFVVRTLACG